MIIVAGHFMVAPDEREAYLESTAPLVERARAVDGCLDFAGGADRIDPGRINVFERWESQTALDAFRRTARGGKRPKIVTVSVEEYDIADTRPLSGKRGK